MPMTEKELNWLAEITGNTSILMTESNALEQEKEELEAEKNQEGISPEKKQEIEQKLVLNAQQKEFQDKRLKAINLRIKNAEEAKEREKLRQTHLLIVRSRVESIKQEILDAFDVQVKLKRAKFIESVGLPKKKLSMLGEQSQSFDFEADIQDIRSDFLKGNTQEWSAATAKIKTYEFQMRELFYDWSVEDESEQGYETTKKNLFEAKDIEKELYTPLVRQKVYPDTMVNAEYSYVQQMIDGSNDAYIEELSGVKKNAVLKENVVLFKSLVRNAASIAGDAGDIAEELGVMSEDVNETFEALTKLGEAALTTGADVISSLSDKEYRKATAAILAGMSLSVGGLISNQTGNEEIGTCVTLAMKAAGETVRIDPKNPEEAINGFIEVAFGGLALKTDDEADYILSFLSVGLVAAVKAEAGTREAITYLATADPIDWGRVKNLLLQGLHTATETALRATMIAVEKQRSDRKEELEEKQNDKGKELSKQEERELDYLKFILNEMEDTAEELDAEVDEDPEAEEEAEQDKARRKKVSEKRKAAKEKKIKAQRSKLWKSVDIPDDKMGELEAAAKAHDAEVLETAKEQMEVVLEKELEEFRESMDLLNSPEDFTGDEQQMQSIDKIIQKMKNDQKIMKTATEIASKGAELAKFALEQLGPGPALVNLVATIAAAVERAKALRKWVQSSFDASIATSPYYTSIANFVRNQAEQFSHYAIKAALLVIKLAGEIVALTPYSAVGRVISSAASIAISIEDALYTVYRRIELEAAWAITKKALADPHNRRLNLAARKINPTLAKYTLAFGAIEHKDPIACRAMHRLNLSQEVLEDPNASVAKVKDFLETKYDEDIQVKRYYEQDKGWISKIPEIDFSARNWLIIIQLATAAEAGLISSHNDIVKNLRDLEKKESAYLKLKEETLAEIETKMRVAQEYRGLLMTSTSAFSLYTPQKSNQEPHDDLVVIAQRYVDLIENELLAMNAVMIALENKKNKLEDA